MLHQIKYSCKGLPAVFFFFFLEKQKPNPMATLNIFSPTTSMRCFLKTLINIKINFEALKYKEIPCEKSGQNKVSFFCFSFSLNFVFVQKERERDNDSKSIHGH
jgi:hypothetical protein